MRSVELAAKQIQTRSAGAWLNDWSRSALIGHLSKLAVGRLILKENGETWVFGDENATDYCAEIHVADRDAYRRVLFGGTVGSGEAFMLGLWRSPDLTAVVRLMLANRAHLNNMDTWFSKVKKVGVNLMELTRLNSLAGSKRNICAHYDLSNDFFKLFLDKTMMYSAAIYTDQATDLERAAEYKLKHICERLQLKPSDKVIEIGSGWGGMAIYAAKHYGCHVTTTTISNEQYDLAQQRIREQGLEDKITLLKKDYRLLEGRYDKLVSIEMIEAVGHQYYKQFFRKCNSLLKEDGLALIQAITISDDRFDEAKSRADFIRRYIFPGGCLPSNKVIATMLSQHTNMQCVGFEDITLHYAQTLRDWRARFMAKITEVKAQGFDDVFCRMWDYYLCYCEGGFDEREIHTGQFLFAKPKARNLPKIA